MKYITRIDDKEYIIEIKGEEVFVNDEPYSVDMEQMGGLLSLIINNKSFEAAIDEDDEGYNVMLKGEVYNVTVQDERAYRLAMARGELADASGDVNVKSPMPGTIIAVPVAVGDSVKKGDAVVILESMKMENELKSPRDGVILAVSTEAGKAVEKGESLVTIGDAE